MIEVQKNETVSVSPLEGNLKKQQKLKSPEAMVSYQVAVKRINIPRRRPKTGRLWYY
jgi:hypothetical protein